jgi:hypothetical protein
VFDDVAHRFFQAELKRVRRLRRKPADLQTLTIHSVMRADSPASLRRTRTERYGAPTQSIIQAQEGLTAAIAAKRSNIADQVEPPTQHDIRDAAIEILHPWLIFDWLR